MPSRAFGSVSGRASVRVTSRPDSANTCAMPWPIRPAPTTAIFLTWSAGIGWHLRRDLAGG